MHVELEQFLACFRVPRFISDSWAFLLLKDILKINTDEQTFNNKYTVLKTAMYTKFYDV